MKTLAGLLSIFFVLALLALFFLAVFHYRPSFAVATLSTAAFVVVILCLIQKLEPVFGSLALRIYPFYPLDRPEKDDVSFFDRTEQKDLKVIEKELKSLDSRSSLSRLAMLEYMDKVIQRQKMEALKLKEVAPESSSSEEEDKEGEEKE